jgi:hypothetical protein
VAAAAASSARLAPELGLGPALRVGGAGHLRAGARLAEATRRVWWPLAAVAAVRSRRARRALLLGLLPLLADWSGRRRPRPRLDPLRWLGLRLLDDLAYGAGVWWGAWRARSPAALLPARSPSLAVDGPSGAVDQVPATPSSTSEEPR